MATKGVQVGGKFGRLTAVEKTGEVRHSRPVWKCQCDCGQTKAVVSSSLLRGDTKSCGCFGAEQRKAPRPHADLTGVRFGQLVVIAKNGKKGRDYAWRCLCDCGSETTVRAGALKIGHTQSCGCLTKKAVSEATSSKIAGKRFGRLVAVERIGKTDRGAAIWACRCDCGNDHVALAGVLNAGRLISCGCASIDRPGLRSAKVRHAASTHDHKRRARVKGAGGSFTPEQITDLYLKQRGRCANCGTKLGDKFHRDHKTALADGGSNAIENIELLCKPCNLRKNAKDPIAWAQLNGRLI